MCFVLLGHDPEKHRVRSVAFEYSGHGDILARGFLPGQAFSGRVADDAGKMGQRVLEYMGTSRTPEAARAAMQRVISEQAKAYPTFFGEPAHFFAFEVE